MTLFQGDSLYTYTSNNEGEGNVDYVPSRAGLEGARCQETWLAAREPPRLSCGGGIHLLPFGDKSFQRGSASLGRPSVKRPPLIRHPGLGSPC